MRTARVRHVATVLSVVASLANPASPARAVEPQGYGVLCGYTEVPDPQQQTDTALEHVTVGPVSMTEADGVTPASGTMYCRVAVSGADHTTPGTDVAGRGTGVVAGRSAVVRVPTDRWRQVSLCTRFDNESDGATYYWDEGQGAWSTDPSTPCDVPYGHDDEDIVDPLLDSLVCPVFAAAFPPEGDVDGVWDCPPYGDLGPVPIVPGLLPPCSDGIDEDGDGLIDYPADPGCASAGDRDEHSYAACDDGADSDGDGAVDFPNDPGCASASDTSERGTNQCDDGIDNDGDHLRDYVLDPGCDSPADPTE